MNRFFPKPTRPVRVYDQKQLSDPHNPGSSINYLEEIITKYDSLYKNSNTSLEGKVCLDLGCGSGGGTISLAQQGVRKVIGLDLQESLLRQGNEYLNSKYNSYLQQLDFVRGDGSSLPFRYDSFDVVISNDVLEHMEAPALVMKEIFRVLKEDGVAELSFSTYFGPRASHLGDFIHIPWSQVLFSDATLSVACRKLIERSCYQDTLIHRYEFEDPFATGCGLNRLALRDFKEILFKLEDVEIIKLRVTSHSRFLQPITYLPLTNEFFIDSVTCVLRKKKGGKITKGDLVKLKVLNLRRDVAKTVSLFSEKIFSRRFEN